MILCKGQIGTTSQRVVVVIATSSARRAEDAKKVRLGERYAIPE